MQLAQTREFNAVLAHSLNTGTARAITSGLSNLLPFSEPDMSRLFVTC